MGKILRITNKTFTVIFIVVFCSNFTAVHHRALLQKIDLVQFLNLGVVNTTHLLFKYFITFATYAEVCNELAEPIFLAPTGNTASFEKISQRWRAVGNTLFNLTGPRFEPRVSGSINEHVTA